MITYAGLGRLLSIAAGRLSMKLPAGHVAILTLGAVIAECRKLAGQDSEAASPTILRAHGLGDRGLWRHSCGNVGLGAPITDLQPRYCESCQQTGFWERLYITISASAPEETH